MPKLYNLELHVKEGDKYIHQRTLVWQSPYALCRGQAIKERAYKAHFEFLKIVPNKKATIKIMRYVSSVTKTRTVYGKLWEMQVVLFTDGTWQATYYHNAEPTVWSAGIEKGRDESIAALDSIVDYLVKRLEQVIPANEKP